MTKEKLAVWFTILVIFVTGVGLAVSSSNNARASEQCYRNFPKAYTWRSIRPQMDEIWADKKITVYECENMKDLYKQALVDREAEKMDARLETLR